MYPPKLLIFVIRKIKFRQFCQTHLLPKGAGEGGVGNFRPTYGDDTQNPVLAARGVIVGIALISAN